MTTTTTNVTNTLQKARAATLLVSVQQRGTIIFTHAELAAWGQRGWSLTQIVAAARGLEATGEAQLTTAGDGTHTIRWMGGGR